MTAQAEMAGRRTANIAYRAGAGAALAASFLTVWVNAAVGMIGSEYNPYNILFLALLPAALIGAVLVRFRAEGLARVMILCGIAQLGLGTFGMYSDVRGGIFSAVFAGLWFLSAVLFRKAARD